MFGDQVYFSVTSEKFYFEKMYFPLNNLNGQSDNLIP